jgi:hypothetical protein
MLDGTLLPIDQTTADRPFYSGKHKKHGMNVQVLADPAGRLLWASSEKKCRRPFPIRPPSPAYLVHESYRHPELRLSAARSSWLPNLIDTERLRVQALTELTEIEQYTPPLETRALDLAQTAGHMTERQISQIITCWRGLLQCELIRGHLQKTPASLP